MLFEVKKPKTRLLPFNNKKRSRANPDAEPGCLELDKIEKFQKIEPHCSKENLSNDGIINKKIKTFSLNLQDQYDLKTRSSNKKKSYGKACSPNKLQTFLKNKNTLSFEEMISDLTLLNKKTFLNHLDKMKIAGLSQERDIENHLYAIIKRKSFSNKSLPASPIYEPLQMNFINSSLSSQVIQNNGGNYSTYFFL